ncbi:hypothetical protein Ctob_005958 [Chrysochromulina tobinii]|uniref:Uncharacterized protein n=1 Tax=Chrysochromulina tobinii TaxID=1460289 RepID=A0A0M0JDZ0_9EUKA|nr:hypothetical protein Ctob_005958 [Chrysochromulina tobinii]|eukprot:KOO24796.1 hypothetical protein Ctob_005958 [Chrysochromulina sp. CCMP291]
MYGDALEGLDFLFDEYEPTFFTGLYGMNFDVLPELHNENSYFALWGCFWIWWLGWLIFFLWTKQFKPVHTVKY